MSFKEFRLPDPPDGEQSSTEHPMEGAPTVDVNLLADNAELLILVTVAVDLNDPSVLSGS